MILKIKQILFKFKKYFKKLMINYSLVFKKSMIFLEKLTMTSQVPINIQGYVSKNEL